MTDGEVFHTTRIRRGEITNFTGIDSAYEVPEQPEIRLETTRQSADLLAEEIVAYLHKAGRLLSPAR